MSQSNTNKIIANLKQSTFNDSTNYLNSNNVVCIDSSNNRIGINTRNPRFSIEISGSKIDNGLKSNYLQIDICANINNIDCSNLVFTNELSGNKIDVSDIFFKTVSGEIINSTTLICNDISSIDICVNNLTVDSIINCTSDTSSNIKRLDVSFLKVDELTVTEEQDFNFIKFVRAEGRTLDISNLNTNKFISNSIDISNGSGIIKDLSLSNLDVSVNLDVSSANFKSITIENADGLKINTDNINTHISRVVIADNTLRDQFVPKDISFDTINLPRTSGIDGTINLNGNLQINSGIVDGTTSTLIGNEIIAKNKLVIPSTTGTGQFTKGSIILDNNTVKVYKDSTISTPPIELKTTKKKLYKLDLSINDYNKIKLIDDNTYEISGNNYYQYIIDEHKYKYFDITLSEKPVDDNITEISNNGKIIITNPDLDYLNINANIGLRLINVNANDVEVKNYELCLIEYLNNNEKLTLVSTKNTILAYDVSYNYSSNNISFTYNKKLGTTSDNNNSKLNPEISFLIKSVDDLCLNNIIVDSFTATILQS